MALSHITQDRQRGALADLWPLRRRFTPRRQNLLLFAGCVLAAALTLLLPSVPSHDPWSWLVWGREVINLDLQTRGGPSWKPLPVLLTAPFSLAGSAAPELWLVTARAATFGAVVVAIALGRRLGGWPAGALAGAILLLSPWLWGDVWTGNSEGILVLCVLGAAERHLGGHRAHAFALGVAAALLRPEAWLFLGLYALWLFAEDRRRLAWVVPVLALVPALWLLPDLWGSGTPLQGAERARQPGADAPAISPRPALTVIENAVRMPPPYVPLGVAAWVLGLLVRTKNRPNATPSLVLAALALSWLLLVALMAEFGFSGINRYLVAPVAIACVLAGVGAAWALTEIFRPGRLRHARIAGVLLIGVLGAVAVAPKFDGDYPLVNQLVHEAAVVGELDTAIERAGGERAFDACGPVYASFQTTPVVSWTLGRHLEDVTAAARPPGTVFRAQLILGEPIDPPWNAMAGAPDRRELARTEHWHVEAACQAG